MRLNFLRSFIKVSLKLGLPSSKFRPFVVADLNLRAEFTEFLANIHKPICKCLKTSIV